MASGRRKSQLFLFELPSFHSRSGFSPRFTQDGSLNLRDPDFSIGILQFLGSCASMLSFYLIND